MNPMRQLQEDSVALLLGNPNTAVVSFDTFRDQVIAEMQSKALAGWKVRVPGKIGLTALVLMPKARNRYPNVPGPQLKLELTIRTFEDPRVNNTGQTCEDVAIENLRWMDGVLIGGITQLYSDDEAAVTPNYDYPGLLVYDSVLMGSLPQDYLGRTPAPTFVDNLNGTVNLHCSDSAAQIYFTLDGTMPQPGLASQLYGGGPVATPLGTTLTFLAWNPALLPSDVPRAVIVPP